MRLPPFVSSLDDVVAGIQDGTIRRIVALAGAGLSVNSGINDYRSKGGLYQTLDPATLTATEEIQEAIRQETSLVASKEIFDITPCPYLETKRHLMLSLEDKVWKPTAAHHILAGLHKRGLLAKVITQNIDGLEYTAGLPTDSVIQIHGNLREVRCHACGAPGSFAEWMHHLRHNVRDLTGRDGDASDTTTPATCGACTVGHMRPSIVMYGESSRPEDLQAAHAVLAEADALFIVGSSLTVAPPSLFPQEVPEGCPRVVFDKFRVGEGVGLRYGRGRDLLVQGDIDDSLLHLADRLGWLEEVRGIAGASPPLMSPTSLARVAAAPRPCPAAEDAAGAGQDLGCRIEQVIDPSVDLRRWVYHSREASISIPCVGVELSSYVTAGQRMDLGTFLLRHAEEVRRNMQMVMGGGSKKAVERFVADLDVLRESGHAPWVLVVDDPTGEAVVRGLETDTADVRRVVRYQLAPGEQRLLGR